MRKSLIYISVLVFAFSVKGYAQQETGSGETGSLMINWPAEYEPSKAKCFVHNRIQVNAPPEIVWKLLIDAEKWPDWYAGASRVELINSEDGILEDGTVFTWKTMGLNFRSTIREFVPYSRLSWDSEKRSIQGYHAWLIVPNEKGCTVITDESQFGWLTFFEKLFQPNKLRRLHDIWLAGIKRIAESQYQDQIILKQ